ncbi:SGNH/GDSL hydrolase family protein [Mesobacillus jeotgali]|uniref:SGNH/GDSL hydrolase family protein n=1 Tax=Mesobacillus jeotgali TaxID=129985 RepID=A0ABY9VIG7_9BACI|nr:SGNH/GDSL hydrolase family protein [Mesobacillus jeotgali]WNF22672.1 SGNH/GDSL hydrolase family protein [Mesobacillus jeotgali]
MKAFLTTILAVLCAVVVIWGNLHWNEKNVLSGSKRLEQPTNTDSETTQTESSGFEELIKLTGNWPAESQETFKSALEDNRPFKILIIGSEAIGPEGIGWASLTKNNIMEAYGSDFVSVEIFDYPDSTKQFAQEGVSKLAEAKADIILFEPFTLTDNDELKIEDSIGYIEQIMDGVKEANPQTVFILQPPNPIFGPRYYATQVEGLREFAETKEIEYLDHWDAWPDTSSEEIKKYVEDSTNLPTAEGHQLWSEFISNYFIKK